MGLLLSGVAILAGSSAFGTSRTTGCSWAFADLCPSATQTVADLVRGRAGEASVDSGAAGLTCAFRFAGAGAGTSSAGVTTGDWATWDSRAGDCGGSLLASTVAGADSLSAWAEGAGTGSPWA